MTRVYLDYNATAPIRPEARAAMERALDAPGNASSVHGEGRKARALIEAARAEVGALVGAGAKAVTFTSGGTEANNAVLTRDWNRGGTTVGIGTLVCSATEHPSVLAGGRFPADRIKRVPVDDQGIVSLAGLRTLLVEAAARSERALVSVMLANNETGAIQPVKEVADIVHEFGCVMHSDAVQAAGRIPVDIKALGVDVLTLSSHKIGGPQGAGAIVLADEALAFASLLTGGGQEMGHRAGTENVSAIAGFGAAAVAAAKDAENPAMPASRDRLAAILAEGIAGRNLKVFSEKVARLPQTLCFAIEGTSAETLLIALDLEGIAVSSGSACSSGKVAASHVLSAMGVPENIAKGAIRLSLGWDSKESDLDLFSTAWRRVLKHLAPGAIRAA